MENSTEKIVINFEFGHPNFFLKNLKKHEVIKNSQFNPDEYY